MVPTKRKVGKISVLRSTNDAFGLHSQYNFRILKSILEGDGACAPLPWEERVSTPRFSMVVMGKEYYYIASICV